MGYCTNCKTRLTCGCQKRVSTKGIAGCTNCINQLNATAPPQQNNTPQPKSAPKNTGAIYKGPGMQI